MKKLAIILLLAIGTSYGLVYSQNDPNDQPGNRAGDRSSQPGDPSQTAPVDQTTPGYRTAPGEQAAPGNSRDVMSQPENSSLKADSGRWKKIGEATVNLQKDRDDINVTASTRIQAIMIKSKDASIDVKKVDVYIEGGNKQSITVNAPVSASGETKRIDLNGAHTIDKISINYTPQGGTQQQSQSQGKSKMTKVEIWGLSATSAENY